MVLFGFPTRDERDTFEALITATGVGPKLALAILGVHPPNALRRCLADGRPRRARARARCRQAHRAAAARRAEGPARRCPTSISAGRGLPVGAACRGARSARRTRLRARRGPRRARGPRRRRARRDAAARGAAPAEARPRVRDELLSPRGRTRWRRPRRRRCGRAARRVRRPAARSSEQLEIDARRRQARAARPSTTCCSRARPASARRRSPASSRSRWARACSRRSGPALERAGDLAAILTNLDDGDVLFIDEVHRLPAHGRRGALSGDGGLPARHRDRQGPDGAHRSGSICPRFTLVGATTRTGLITGPLRDRFGFVARLDYYDADDLAAILAAFGRDPRRRSSSADGRDARSRGARRGTPRIANRLAATRPRLRGGARRRHASTLDTRARARAVRGRRARASTRSTARSSARCAARSAASRSGSTRSRSRWASSPRRSRTSTSRSCMQCGLVAAHAARPRRDRRRRSRTSGCRRAAPAGETPGLFEPPDAEARSRRLPCPSSPSPTRYTATRSSRRSRTARRTRSRRT